MGGALTVRLCADWQSEENLEKYHRNTLKIKHTPSLLIFVFLDAQASLAPTQVSLSVRP